MPGDVTTSVGSAAGALSFHLGVEESPSARAPGPAAALCHPFFPVPHPHPSPRPLTSSFLSPEAKGGTGTAVLYASALGQWEESSGQPRAPCGLQASPEEESRTGTGVLSAAALGPGGMQRTAPSSLRLPGSTRQDSFPLEKWKTLVWVGRREEGRAFSTKLLPGAP